MRALIQCIALEIGNILEDASSDKADYRVRVGIERMGVLMDALAADRKKKT